MKNFLKNLPRNLKNFLKNFLFKLAIHLIARTIRNGTPLTPNYLIDRGWKFEVDHLDRGICTETNVKDKEKVQVVFEAHYYRVYHGKELTFIALENTAEWLELYLLLRSKHVQFRKPIDIFEGKGI